MQTQYFYIGVWSLQDAARHSGQSNVSPMTCIPCPPSQPMTLAATTAPAQLSLKLSVTCHRNQSDGPFCCVSPAFSTEYELKEWANNTVDGLRWGAYATNLVIARVEVV